MRLDKKILHTIKRPLLIRLWMDLIKVDGLTTWWGVIYYRNIKDMHSNRLRRHELKHVEQMQREGTIKFLIKYNYYWLRYGYWNNPYEIEARKAEVIKL